MYVDSGGGTAANLYEADFSHSRSALACTRSSMASTLPLPKVVFTEDVAGADAHGAALTKHNSYLWVAIVDAT